MMGWREALLHWRIQFKRGTTEAWTSANTVLMLAEPGWDQTLLQMKVGDGVTPWNELPYASLTPEQLADVIAILGEGLDETITEIAADVDSDLHAYLLSLVGVDAVTSVNGETGAVVLSAADVGAQPVDADLTAIAALSSAANKMPYSTGVGAWSLADLSVFARTMLDDADAATLRATIGFDAAADARVAAAAATGTGNLVRATSPTLVTPALGTPSSGVATNLTGLPLTTGVTGTLGVTNGGTGRATSTTAYGVLAAGTTATGAHQTIAPGASGHFLKSGGAAALAAFAAITAADVSGLSGTYAPLAGPTFTGTVTAPTFAATTGITTPAFRMGTSTTSGWVMTTDASGNGTWQASTGGGGGGGDVTGPASSVVNRVATFNSITGKVIKDSGVLISDLMLASTTFDDLLTVSSDSSFVAFAVPFTDDGDTWTAGLLTGDNFDPTYVDGVAGSPSLRTLGTGAQQAAAGNHLHTGVYQPNDAELTAIAGLVSAADRLPYFTGLGTAALATFTSAGRALVDDADASAQLTTLGVSAFAKTILDDANAAAVITTLGLASVYQPLDGDLTAIAGLTSAADRLPYFTGAGTAALATFTSAGRALVDDADASAQLTTLGVSAFMKTVLDDADAAAVRTTLGITADAAVMVYATDKETFSTSSLVPSTYLTVPIAADGTYIVEVDGYWQVTGSGGAPTFGLILNSLTAGTVDGMFRGDATLSQTDAPSGSSSITTITTHAGATTSSNPPGHFHYSAKIVITGQPGDIQAAFQRAGASANTVVWPGAWMRVTKIA